MRSCAGQEREREGEWEERARWRGLRKGDEQRREEEVDAASLPIRESGRQWAAKSAWARNPAGPSV